MVKNMVVEVAEVAELQHYGQKMLQKYIIMMAMLV